MTEQVKLLSHFSFQVTGLIVHFQLPGYLKYQCATTTFFPSVFTQDFQNKDQ